MLCLMSLYYKSFVSYYFISSRIYFHYNESYVTNLLLFFLSERFVVSREVPLDIRYLVPLVVSIQTQTQSEANTIYFLTVHGEEEKRKESKESFWEQ